jgi:hypothetical protein
MQLELTDEETFALLNLLVETIEADKFPLSAARSDLARHPRQVRADGPGATTTRAAADTGGARAGPGRRAIGRGGRGKSRPEGRGGFHLYQPTGPGPAKPFPRTAAN